MAIAGFKVAEFSTARELALFVNTADDVETIYATTFNTASGKYSIFFANLPSVASVYARGLSETANARVSDATAWKSGDRVGESVVATDSEAMGLRGVNRTITETASATDTVNRSDP